MPAYMIENKDDAGEGLFFVAARDKREAIRIHNRKESQAKIVSIEVLKWCSLASVSGERGETYYFNRSLLPQLTKQLIQQIIRKGTR